MLGDNQEAGVTLYSGPPEFHQSSPEEKLGMAILFIIAAPFLMVGAFVALIWIMAVVAWAPGFPPAEHRVMQEMFWMIVVGVALPVGWLVYWAIRKIARSRGR
jgi:hypothetical protein